METVILILFLFVVFMSVCLWPRGRSSLSKLRQGIFEHLTVITRCGLPVGPGLRALADERAAGGLVLKDKKAAEVIRGIASRFEAVGSLAAAFEGAPRGLLAPTQLDLLRASERHGALPHALNLLCDEEVERTNGRWRLIQWLTYPTVVAMIVIPMSMFQTLVILPKFREIQLAMDVQPTSSLAASATMALTACLLVLSLVLVGLDRWQLPHRIGRALATLFDLVLWGAPFRRRRHGRWLSRTAAMLRSGATLPEALDSSAGLLDVGGKTLADAARQAREGQPLEVVLGTAFGQDAPRLLQPALLSIESSGSLGLGLEASGAREQERANRKLGAVIEMLRPLPILICALVVAAHVHAVWGSILSVEQMIVRNVW